MAEKPAQDKTEEPTTRHRKESVNEGNVAKSRDVNSVAVLIAGVLALQFNSAKLIEGLSLFIRNHYRNIAFTPITVGSVPDQTLDTVKFLLSLLAPILFLLLFAGVGANYMQVGFIFAKKALKPKFSKLSPISGIKRLISIRSIVEAIKGMFKIAIVGLIAFSVLKKYLDEYWILSYVTIEQTFAFLGKVLYELGMKVGLTLIFLAAADFAYQKYEYEKNLKMTKQEVKDEQKQQDGNPLMKGKIRARQKQIARSRMMTAVPDATVVVTNPTYIAVALKYTPVESNDAPIVVAKGKRLIAKKIKEIALKNNVPVIENKPLARTLYDTTEIDMEISTVFYQAVAEILAQVYQMNKEREPLTTGQVYAG